MFIEVRDLRTGYLLPVREAEGTLPDLESSWDVAAATAAAVSWKMPKYKETQTFLPKWACLKFPDFLFIFFRNKSPCGSILM